MASTARKIRLLRPSHVFFAHSDLDKFVRFASDFGLVEVSRANGNIYFRGYGKDPYVYVASQSSEAHTSRFHGAAFVAASQKDFDRAAELEGAQVHDLKDAPGGGKMVTIPRPSGTWFHVVYGQQERSGLPSGATPPSVVAIDHGEQNYPSHKPRQGRFQRFQKGPALVHKLGHFGYACQDFDEEFHFYTTHFNFTPSDIMHDTKNPDIDVMVFMHLDLGSTYVDHHCFFLARNPPDADHTYVHHSSFEVSDYDEQMMGHEYLASQGWESVWGVGRHILGSQIFDYWYDSSGFKIEHYADGDVVNDTHKVTREPAGPISIWGPELPKDFGGDHSLIGYG